LADNPFLERTAQSLYHIGAEVRRASYNASTLP
jgi:hypothetical protein